MTELIHPYSDTHVYVQHLVIVYQGIPQPCRKSSYHNLCRKNILGLAKQSFPTHRDIHVGMCTYSIWNVKAQLKRQYSCKTTITGHSLEYITRTLRQERQFPLKNQFSKKFLGVWYFPLRRCSTGRIQTESCLGCQTTATHTDMHYSCS